MFSALPPIELASDQFWAGVFGLVAGALLAWVVNKRHPRHPDGLPLVARALGYGLIGSLLVWVMFVAFRVIGGHLEGTSVSVEFSVGDILLAGLGGIAALWAASTYAGRGGAGGPDDGSETGPRPSAPTGPSVVRYDDLRPLRRELHDLLDQMIGAEVEDRETGAGRFARLQNMKAIVQALRFLGELEVRSRFDGER